MRRLRRLPLQSVRDTILTAARCALCGCAHVDHREVVAWVVGDQGRYARDLASAPGCYKAASVPTTTSNRDRVTPFVVRALVSPCLPRGCRRGSGDGPTCPILALVAIDRSLNRPGPVTRVATPASDRYAPPFSPP